MTYEGACHCGSVVAWLESAKSAEDIQVRACDCSFCRRHGAHTVSDPDGWMEVRGAPGSITHYRFGAGATDFLLCSECGVYVAATIQDGEGLRGVINVAGVAIAALSGLEPQDVSYAAEDAAAKMARRQSAWTPAAVVEAMPNA